MGNMRVKPEEAKLDAVKNFSIPQGKKEVRAFLGLTGHYRKFIQGYATPLTDLTKKNAPNRVEWTSQCDYAFRSLKTMLPE